MEQSNADRIVEIQSRIAALRSSFGWTEESNKSTPTQSKPLVESSQQSDNSDTVRREKELSDIKAKLLGKKK